MPIRMEPESFPVKKRRPQPSWLAPGLSVLCFTMLACGSTIDPAQMSGGADVATKQSTLTVPTPIAPDGTVQTDLDSALPGRGYDPVLKQWLSICVEDVGVATVTGGDALRIFSDSSKIDTLQELSNSFGATANLSGGVGSIFQAGLGFSYGRTSQFNSYGTNYVGRVTVVGLQRTLNQFMLKQWVVDRIKADPTFVSSGQFGQLCGSQFVSAYKPGGELYIFLSRQNSSATEKTSIDAELNFKILSFVKGDASVKSEIEQKLGQDHLSMSVYSSGAVITLPTLDAIPELVKNFPVKVAEAKGWPLHVTLTPYTMVENYPNLDSPPNWAMDRVLKSLADLRAAILPIYLDDVYIGTHRDQFDPGKLDTAALDESLRVADASLKAIEAAAQVCYVNSNCSLPDPLPTVPRRPVSSDMPKPDTEFRAIWRAYPECQPGAERPGGPSADEGCKLTEICGMAGTWQGGSTRKDCTPTCKANEEKLIVGTTIDGCNVVKVCSPAGTWSGGTTYNDCICQRGVEKRACSCPECGNKEKICTWGDGTFSDCPCNRTCPNSNFSPDGGVCTWPAAAVDYQSWTCGTPEHSVFMQLNVPAECDDPGAYDCKLEFNLNDKGGSCDRSTKSVIQLECADGTPLRRYTSAEVAGGWKEDKLVVPPGCNLVRMRKLTTEAGICFYGCVRYLNEVKLKVKTKNQCTF